MTDPRNKIFPREAFDETPMAPCRACGGAPELTEAIIGRYPDGGKVLCVHVWCTKCLTETRGSVPKFFDDEALADEQQMLAERKAVYYWNNWVDPQAS